MPKVLVGMSGGVDSSVTAYLLQKQGYDVVGITLKLYAEASRCCNLDDIDDAKSVAHKLGISHYVADLTGEFKDKVIQYFVDEYQRGNTPNPCPLCNEEIKFAFLLQRARELGIDKIATGHYAKVIETPRGLRLTLAKDTHKSQEYFLALLPDEILKNLLLPLADYKKDEVRKIAQEAGLVQVSHKKDSQEVCFIPEGDYVSFIEKFTGQKAKSGDIVTTEGKKVGIHQGIYRFTIGQRRGICGGLDKPYYVTDIDAAKNKIIIGSQEESSKKTIKVLLKRQFEPFELNKTYHIKVRYKNEGTDGIIENEENGILNLRAKDFFFAPAPGQLAVFYNEEKQVVLAGEIVR